MNHVEIGKYQNIRLRDVRGRQRTGQVVERKIVEDFCVRGPEDILKT